MCVFVSACVRVCACLSSRVCVYFVVHTDKIGLPKYYKASLQETFGEPVRPEPPIEPSTTHDIDYYCLCFKVDYIKTLSSLANTGESPKLHFPLDPGWVIVVNSPIAVLVPKQFRTSLLDQAKKHGIFAHGGREQALFKGHVVRDGVTWEKILQGSGVERVLVAHWGQKQPLRKFTETILPFAIESEYNQLDLSTNRYVMGFQFGALVIQSFQANLRGSEESPL